jgi:hypothetical protein
MADWIRRHQTGAGYLLACLVDLVWLAAVCVAGVFWPERSDPDALPPLFDEDLDMHSGEIPPGYSVGQALDAFTEMERRERLLRRRARNREQAGPAVAFEDAYEMTEGGSGG